MVGKLFNQYAVEGKQTGLFLPAGREKSEVRQSTRHQKMLAQWKTDEHYRSMIMGFLSELNYPFDPAFVLRKRKALRRKLLDRDVS